MPIFIKAGAIIPMQESMQYVGEKKVNCVRLLVCPEENSTYDLYEDDGVSVDYKEGAYAISSIESSLIDGSWRLLIHKPMGKFQPDIHRYEVTSYLEKS